jgi:hypothetical protein
MTQAGPAIVNSDASVAGALTCSFCQRPPKNERRLVAGTNVFICNACVAWCVKTLHIPPEQLDPTRHSTIPELLTDHFRGVPVDSLVTARRVFPARLRADLQIAIQAMLSPRAAKIVGIQGGGSYETLSFPELFDDRWRPKLISPLQYEELDVGEDKPIRCLRDTLWTGEDGGVRWAVLLSREHQQGLAAGVQIEIAVPSGEDGARLVDGWFADLEKAVENARSYRGKVLSLETAHQFSGIASGIAVQRLAKVERDQIVLPAQTLELLERNLIDFARQRPQLRKLGLPTKKGLLFHGPPGTGKTHTITFLANHLPGHTTLIITAEQVGLIRDYIALARLLQPSILVIEDADLIARERTEMGSPIEEVLLNRLLNEMDGLRTDAEIFFILTTNRPEMIEPALASRPGRIDQAIFFPLPDAAGREKLTRLYAAGLALDAALVERVVARTEGVSAAFIKELMRRTAQYMISRERARPTPADVDLALKEMLADGALNVRLLGGNTTDTRSVP